ncbi:ATP synthase subunit I [Leptolyngbya sp. PCC 6406]|uniref:ATP synthase subunit I n=1 Tax=Leptolyngbya sp. PCC 6406 TaxID=1173264 RepID=UPI0002AC3FA9|nr:ATP synthase subunit I [Leptolyngbya sp. PCC 6406]
MGEYYRLQQTLLVITLTFSAVIFVSVYFVYSLSIALNYLIGACTGVIYLRMLSRSVARLGRQSKELSSGRLALVALLLLVASQWNQLELLPVFLGFLTYKAAIIAYMLWTVIPTES